MPRFELLGCLCISNWLVTKCLKIANISQNAVTDNVTTKAQESSIPALFLCLRVPDFVPVSNRLVTG